MALLYPADDVERRLQQLSLQPLSSIRFVAWLYNLGAIRSITATNVTQYLEKSRRRYEQLRETHVIAPLKLLQSDQSADPLSQDDQSMWSSYFKDLSLKKLIELDVERTFPGDAFFRSQETRGRMSNMLFIYCQLNKAVGYRQGMHDLVALVLKALVHTRAPTKFDVDDIPDKERDQALYVLSDSFLEHDTFTVFEHLMKFASPLFEFEPSGKMDAADYQTPVHRLCDYMFHSLLRELDPPLYSHLRKVDLHPQMFGIRWFRVLFSREFEQAPLFNLWDVLFADKSPAKVVKIASDPLRCDKFELLPFIACSMLIHVRDQLIGEEFHQCLTVLMKYPRLKGSKDLCTDSRDLREQWRNRPSRVCRSHSGQGITSTSSRNSRTPIPSTVDVADSLGIRRVASQVRGSDLIKSGGAIVASGIANFIGGLSPPPVPDRSNDACLSVRDSSRRTNLDPFVGPWSTDQYLQPLSGQPSPLPHAIASHEMLADTLQRWQALLERKEHETLAKEMGLLRAELNVRRSVEGALAAVNTVHTGNLGISHEQTYASRTLSVAQGSTTPTKPFRRASVVMDSEAQRRRQSLAQSQSQMGNSGAQIQSFTDPTANKARSNNSPSKDTLSPTADKPKLDDSPQAQISRARALANASESKSSPTILAESSDVSRTKAKRKTSIGTSSSQNVLASITQDMQEFSLQNSRTASGGGGAISDEFQWMLRDPEK